MSQTDEDARPLDGVPVSDADPEVAEAGGPVPATVSDDPLGFLQHLTEVAPSILYVFDLDEGRNVWVNRSVFAMLGYTEAELASLGGLVIPALMHPDDLARYGGHYDRLRVLEPDTKARFEYRMKHKDGSWRWLASEEIAYRRDEDGRVSQVVGSAHDITEAKEREEHDRTIARELNHRIKNLFSIVPAIVKLSARGTSDVNALRENIVNRIAALARAHALTVEASSEQGGISMEDMVRAVIEPYGDEIDRIVVSGPPVRLSSRGGTAIGLTLHELTTNAAKYGALSRPSGTVRIAWVVEEDARGAARGSGRTLRLLWSEAGGPQVAGPPKGLGFGTRVVDTLIASQGGKVEREWRRFGLSLTVEMPLFPIGSEPRFPADAM